MIADKKLIIVRHQRRAHKAVQYLRKVGFGLFLILLATLVFSYTRAGVYTRTHTRVSAAASSNLNFQGRLMNAGGSVVNDGTYSIEFNLYSVSVAGTTQWTETQAAVTIRNGYFSVQLGSVTPFPGTIDWSQEQWLTMNVNGDGEMAPRLKLTAVPYAFRAGQADSITNGSGTLSAGDILQKAPVTIQSLSSANAGLRLNQTGAGGLIQLQGDGVDVFTLSKTGSIVTAGSVNVDGSNIDIGTSSVAGTLTLNDGIGNTGQLVLAALGSNRTYTFSDNSGVVLLDSTGYAQNGNSFGATAVLGTNDSNSLEFETGGTTRMTIDTSGNVRIGSGVASENLDITGALRLGTTTNSNAGTLRWTGTDFEGYDGASWLSLTDDYKGAPTININKIANEISNSAVNPGAPLQPDDELTFAIEANETWTYRFVVQANSPATADMKFSVSAPAAATCVNAVSNAEDTVTVANLGCGVSSGVMNTAGTADLFEVTGTIVNGANAGSVTLDWAQNTPQAANTTVFAGSYVVAQRVSGTISGLEFMTGGNSFGALAELGTNDNFGLDIQTSGTTRIGIANTGEITFNSLAEATNGILISGGDLNLNGTESIVNIGSDLTGSGALTLASGGGADLTLDSASGVLVLSDATWQRVAAGTTTVNLNDASDTTLSLVNSNGGAVANLLVEGSITAIDFIGGGSGLTALNASNVSSGTIDNARLSTDVALLNVNQTFSSRPTFSDGLILGTSTSTSAGALRWTGTDFEGYDGIQWISLAGGGGGGPTGPGTVSVIKTADEAINTNITPQDDDELTFEIGANEDWTFRFVVQATSPGAADIQFAVTAPSGATCDVSVVEHENATSVADLGCGVASGIIVANAVADTYEIIGSVRNGGTAGDVTLQWSQFVSDGGDTTVLEGSFLSASVEGGGLQFFQNGNGFGQTAILGTTDNFGLNFITNNATALALATNGDATFSGLALLSGGATIGNAAGDSFTITSDAVALPNGLNFDSNTLVIDSTTNSVGFGDATPENKISVNDPATNDLAAQAMIYTGATGNKGLVLQRFAGQTANLFEIQNETGQALTFFNSDGELGLGRGTSFDGALIFNNSTNSNTLRLVTGTATSDKTITLPDESGTLCVQNSVSCGFLLFAEASAQTDSSSDTSLFINKTGASGNILTLQKNGSNVFTIANSGAVEISNSSTAAFKVQSAGGTDVFNIDTSGNIIQIGESDTTGVLFVLDTKTDAGDPTGVNGAQYYNSNDGKSRCYENGAWTDCNTTPVVGETTLGSASATITVNISGSYEYLHCRIDTKGTTGAAGIYMRFNGDNGAAAYGWNTYSIIATAVQDAQDSSDSEIQLLGGNTTAVPSSADINITNFGDTRKTVDWTLAGSSTIGTNMLRFSGGATWGNTVNSVSSVSFVTSANNFNAGSHAWCEGRNVR